MPDTRPGLRRRSIRLRGYDYAQAGAYFVTMCAYGRECAFGEIVEGEMRLNAAGRAVADCWAAIPAHFADAELDEYVIMPNHVHGIVVLSGVGTPPAAVGATPVADGVTPVADGATPVADGVTPVTVGMTPVADGVTPVADGVAPVTVGMTPVADGVTPVADGVMPVADGATPVTVGATTPAVGAQHAAPLPRQSTPPQTNVAPGSLGAIVRSFKSAATKRIHDSPGDPGRPVWQRNYYEHIVRDERELDALRRYIRNNPLKWSLDRDNPQNHQPVSPSAAPYVREAVDETMTSGV